MRRGMRTSQELFPLRLEPDIQVRLWKKLFATGAQTTWFLTIFFNLTTFWREFNLTT